MLTVNKGPVSGVCADPPTSAVDVSSTVHWGSPTRNDSGLLLPSFYVS